jgi:ankyrin repeat protein
MALVQNKMDFISLEENNVFTEDNAEFLRNLLSSKKLDVEHRDPTHGTLLCAAASFFCVNTVKLLLQNDADVNARDQKGNTPLHCLIYAMHDPLQKKILDKRSRYAAEDIFSNLLFEQPKLNIMNFDDKTTLRMAAEFNSIFTFELLILTVIKPDDADEMSYLLEKNLINGLFDLNKILHEAVVNYSSGTALVLLRAGAAVNKVDHYGGTLMHHAISNMHATCQQAPQDDDDFYEHARAYHREFGMVCLLRSYGADLSIQDINGETVLHFAVAVGDYHFMKGLIRMGAWRSLKTKDSYGNTPQDNAACWNSPLQYVLNDARMAYDTYVLSIALFSHRHLNMPDLAEKMTPRPAMFQPKDEYKTPRGIFEYMFSNGSIWEIDGVVRTILYLSPGERFDNVPVDHITYDSDVGRRSARARLIRAMNS